MSISQIAILTGSFMAFSASLRADDSPARLSTGHTRLSVTQQRSAPAPSAPLPTPPARYGYDRPPLSSDPPRLVREIQAAIAADPQNGNHHFNLAVASGILLSPPDLPTARAAYH